MTDKDNEYVIIGAVFGKTKTTELQFVIDGEITYERPIEIGEYVGIQYLDDIAIGLVTSLETENTEIIESLANSPQAVRSMKQLAMQPGAEVKVGTVNIQGFVKNGKLEKPRYPPTPGTPVLRDPNSLLKNALKEQGVKIGKLRGNPEIDVTLNLSQLVSRHFSILAMTGAGKSYTTSVMIDQIMRNYPSASIVVIDPHEDYNYMRENPHYGERVQIFNIDGSNGHRAIKFKVSNLSANELESIVGIHHRFVNLQAAFDYVFKRLDKTGNDWDLNDFRDRLEKLSEPPEDASKEIKKLSDPAFSLRRRMRSINEEQFLDKIVETPVASDSKLEVALTKKGQLTIINTGLLNRAGKESLVNEVLKRIFSASIAWRRNSNEMQLTGPVLIILEEAHQFAPPEDTRCKGIIQQIAGEGRKFGVGLGIITQRPGKVDQNILSQCNTQITLRITNPRDQSAISNASESMSQDLLNDLPGLNTGEAIITGAAIGLPSMVRINKLDTPNTGGADVPLDDLWGSDPAYEDHFVEAEDDDLGI